MPIAPTNRQVWKNKWRGRTEPVNAFAKTLVRRMGKGRGRKILDIGCGNGTDSLYFSRSGFAVTATDFSESGIETLRSSAVANGLSVTSLLHDTAKKFPFPDATFNAVYAHLALHYFDDAVTRRVFADVQRLLKPNGYFFVKCKSVDDSFYGKGTKVGPDTYRSDHTRHFFSADYMREMLEGFHILSLRRSSSFFHGKRSAFIAAIARK